LVASADYARAYGNEPARYVTLHGDLHGGNVLYDAGQDALGIIDFSSAKLGAPHRDFVQMRRGFSEVFYNVAIESYEQTTGVAIDHAKVDIASNVFELCVKGKLPSPSAWPLRPGPHIAAPKLVT
jgi:aminoglycoside phosphotransferase (APT) family kinase protein